MAQYHLKAQYSVIIRAKEPAAQAPLARIVAEYGPLGSIRSAIWALTAINSLRISPVGPIFPKIK